jgi:hypothetical protein
MLIERIEGDNGDTGESAVVDVGFELIERASA